MALWEALTKDTEGELSEGRALAEEGRAQTNGDEGGH